MIRRDYILRMIQDFFGILSRIKSLKQGQHWREATGELDEALMKLAGSGPETVARLSDTELLARLIQGEPSQVVHVKTLILSALLKEAGDLAADRDRTAEARACY